MKKLLTLFAIALAVVVSSCSKFDDSAIWDKLNEQEQTLNDHEKRIAALEELCKQLNTNINALQTLIEALEKRDYITNVSPVRKDGEVIGYTISFADSDTITIYHGENGQAGADGKDGYTPQIGVMKDTDGIYYWTLDGEWLLDGKGNKVQANGVNGIDGTDGSNGEDGTNGVDGITPRLKIENDYWYVSYDEGATWVEIGKFVSDNVLNKDNIFISVTQDEECVYFNLADGSVIVLPKHINNSNNLIFEDPIVKAICCAHWDTNGDSELSKEEAATVTSIDDIFNGIYYSSDHLVTIGNHSIVSFNELEYFTNVKEIPSTAFAYNINMTKLTLPSSVECIRGRESFYVEAITNYKGVTNWYKVELAPFMNTLISSIVLPETIKYIYDGAFNGAKHLKEIYCKATTPPYFSGYFENGNCQIYVPLESVDAYKTAEGWSQYADQIVSFDFENGVVVK